VETSRGQTRRGAHRALKTVRTTLVGKVEDEIWQELVTYGKLRYQCLRNLEKAIGPEIVSDLEFRIMPPAPRAAKNTEKRLALGCRSMKPPSRIRVFAASNKARRKREIA